jgi:Xaa-Pro dipeptidase
MSAYGERRKRLADRLAGQGIFAAVIEDFESLRSRNLRYLSGHPSDAILVVFADGGCVLSPWDAPLAEKMADVDRIVPYISYRRSFRAAVTALLRDRGLDDAGPGRKIEISSRTPHARYTELCDALEGTEVFCREGGVDEDLQGARAVKDPSEIRSLKKAAEITNELLERIAGRIQGSGERIGEIDLAQLIEKEALGMGAEGLGFETIAAGPARSWGIHAFPSYSYADFGGQGLSVLDFGVKVDGYTSDVTLTAARGPLSGEQKLMISLVERAYAEALPLCASGVPPSVPARRVDEIFAAAGWKMPHGLGHGIGLDTHERPYLRDTGESLDPVLRAGMAFTLEPGLYHPEHGGVRLENDLLISDAGTEVLTRSRIIRI